MSENTSRSFKTKAYSYLSEVGKCFSSPARVEIVELLSQAPLPVESIAEAIEQSVANTSHHLQVLKGAHLVKSTSRGTQRIYSLAGDDVAALLVSFQEVAHRHIEDLRQLTRSFFESRDGLESIDQQTLLQRMRNEDVVLLDVRPEHEFAADHLPDALSVPVSELENKLSALPQDRPIIAYCRGPFCTLSAEVARRLRELGYDARRTDATVASLREHWENVYSTRDDDALSWHRAHLENSLSYIDACDLDSDAHIVDIGAGASTLVDDLLERGFQNLSVIDIAQSALDRSKNRLGERAETVDWIASDVTEPVLEPDTVDLWHDRAVFHFLTDDLDRSAYRDRILDAVKPEGCVVIATFAPDGPERCSGLPVTRHSAEDLARFLGPEFTLVRSSNEIHQTPWGKEQSFTYALLKRSD